MRLKNRSEREHYYQRAIGYLEHAYSLRSTRATLIKSSTDKYGFEGALTSGCEQTHWPESVKNELRTNARAIGAAMEDAYKFWRQAGKRSHTFIRESQKYKHDGSRY